MILKFFSELAEEFQPKFVGDNFAGDNLLNARV